MAKHPRKAGMFHSTKYCYRFRNGPSGTTYVPLQKWRKDNNFTETQCRFLFKKNWLFGMRHKGRVYVAVNPEISDIQAEYNSYKKGDCS